MVGTADSIRDSVKTLEALVQAGDGGGGDYGETDVTASPTYRKEKIKTYMTKYTGKGEVSTGAGVQVDAVVGHSSSSEKHFVSHL